MLKKNKILFYACIIGFVLRIICIFWTANYLDPPDWEYGDIAQNLVTGNGFSRITYPSQTLEPTSSHAPFYPYFLALFYGLLAPPYSFIIVQILQAMVSTAVIIILFRTAKILFDTTTARITALAAAVYPPFVYYSMSMTPTILLIFFLSLTVLLLFDINHKNRCCVLAAGGAYGCALLCDPIAFALIPAAIVWFFVSRQKHKRRFVCAMITALIIILPWTIRNCRIHRTLVPITTQFGVNLWIGNNPRATGTDYYRVVPEPDGHATLMTHTLSRAVKERLNTMTEIERAHYFTSQAFSSIYRHPLRFIGSLFKKTLYYWWFSPGSINGSRIALKYRIFYGFTYAILIACALVGILIFIFERQPLNLTLILGLIVVISGTYIITHVGLIRYRMPVELYILIIAAYGIGRVLTVMRS